MGDRVTDHHCVDCGFPASAHPRDKCKGLKTMALPQGKTCADCHHARFCASFLGDSFKPSSDQCDWYPIRFLPKLAPTVSIDDEENRLP